MNPRRALVFETKMTLRQPAPNPLNEWQWGSRHLPRPNGGRAKRPAEPRADSGHFPSLNNEKVRPVLMKGFISFDQG